LRDAYPFPIGDTHGATWVARIDARLRIIAGLMVVVLIAVQLDPIAYLFLTLIISTGCVVLKLPRTDLRRFLVTFLTMAAVTLVLHLLFNRTGQTGIARVLGLTITQEALAAGLMFSWRLGLFLLAAFCLPRLISPDELALGLWRLLRPFRWLGCATEGIAMSLWVAIRFVPTIFAQYHQIVFAQRARGATFDGGPITRTRKLVPLLIPVTVAALRKSDVFADALVVRGWGLSSERTFYNSRPLASTDYAFLLTAVIWGGVILWIAL